MKVLKFFHKVEILENMAKLEIETADWQKKYEIYVDIKPIYETSLTEISGMNFGHILSEEYYLFTTRFNKDINNKMRIKFGNKLYEIKRVINEKIRNKTLKIIALQI